MDSELDSFLSLAQGTLCDEGAARCDWLENGLREVLLAAGARILEPLLCDPKLNVPGDERRAGEKRMGKQSRTIQTMFGPIRLERTGYYSKSDSSCRYPLDEALLVVAGFTPAAAMLAGRSASSDSFEEASENLSAMAGIEIDSRRIQRLVQTVGPALNEELCRAREPEGEAVPRMYVSADGTGIPMRRDQLAGRKGKQPDGTAKTHEIKTGCIFTQHPSDKDEKPWRDLDSTTYVATTERVDGFSAKLLGEARRRNLGKAEDVVFISDGAAWLKRISRECFPSATWILDFYHATEYLHELVNILFSGSEADRKFARWKKELRDGGIDKIIARASKLCSEKNREAAEKKLNYFRKNIEGMRYGEFRKKGCFIGSGVIEATCKTLVGKRCKQSGMFWSEQGAENILTLRVARKNGDYETIWTDDVLRKIRDIAA